MSRGGRAAAKDWRFDRVSIGYPGLVGPNGPSAEPGILTAFQGGFRLWDMVEPSYKSSNKWRLL